MANIYKLMLNIISKMISKTFLPNSFKLRKKIQFLSMEILGLPIYKAQNIDITYYRRKLTNM